MVDEELAVVHALKDFDVGLRAEGEEVLHLRFGNKRFFRPIPEVNILPPICSLTCWYTRIYTLPTPLVLHPTAKSYGTRPTTRRNNVNGRQTSKILSNGSTSTHCLPDNTAAD